MGRDEANQHSRNLLGMSTVTRLIHHIFPINPGTKSPPSARSCDLGTSAKSGQIGRRQARGGPRRGLIVLAIGLVAGCDSGPRSVPGHQVADPSAPPTASSATGTRPAPVESTPSNGQGLDTRDAVDVVQAEFQGGEADSPTGPTARDFLWQESDESWIADEPYDLDVPTGLLDRAATLVPSYNPMTVGKVELGRQLFYDPRLSINSTVSCASCHDPAKGWTDGRGTSVGLDNLVGARNSQTVLNAGLRRSLFWDGRAPTLEEQVKGPIQNKIEMGDQSYGRIVARLRAIAGYRDQFGKVFGTDVTLDGIAKAVACFERTALSGDSAYDRYLDPATPDQVASLTLDQKRGMILFGLPLVRDDPATKQVDTRGIGRAGCTQCHSGETFSDELFHNLGVGYTTLGARYADLGRWIIAPVGTKAKADRGAFKTPTLRDIARTGPYMHDGTEATLEAVVAFYNKGGNPNPALDTKLHPLNLSEREQADLVAFLRGLTGKVVAVTVPQLPAGPDGQRPDPRAALNAPGGTEPAAQSTTHLPQAAPHMVRHD